MAMSLPYGLFAIDECDFENNDFDEIVIYNGLWYSDEFQTNNNTLMIPILRTLSELTKEIEHKGEKFVPMVYLAKMRSGYLHESEFDRYFGKLKMDISTKRLPFDMMLKLIEWKFDIAGLIDKNEAIDYSTLEGFSF